MTGEKDFLIHKNEFLSLRSARNFVLLLKINDRLHLNILL